MASLTFSEVAREAGVSPQTAMRHLKSKAHMAELAGQAAAMPLDTRSRLLAAAAAVMAERGYAGATLDDIAAAAGLTKGAIYWSYSSKAELFLDLVDQRAGADWTVIRALVEKSVREDDPAAALRRLLALVLQRVLSERDWPRLYLEFLAQTRDPQVLQRLNRYRVEGLRAIADIVRRLQAAGSVASDRDPDRVAVLLAAFFDGLVIGSLVQEPSGTRFGELVEDLAALIDG
ncbi:TetR family transcriptional regulator [Burkholderiaceae bacterium FT117]|nr:TetR family transcriptional regulator [Zeimonas sediminis]